MPSYVITGASRGIGLEFVRQLSRDKDNTIFGLVRNPEASTELAALEAALRNVHVVRGDITDRAALKTAAEQVANVTGGTLDYLINNAAYVPEQRQEYTLDAYPEDEQDLLEKDVVDATKINVLGVIYTINAFLPLLKATASTSTARVIALSSGVGDLEGTLAFNMPVLAPYSISKAAVNMVVAKYATRFRGDNFAFLAISPGLVNTATRPPTPKEIEYFGRMIKMFKSGSPNWDEKPITPETSVRLMLPIIRRWEPKDTGAFISHHGNKEWL